MVGLPNAGFRRSMLGACRTLEHTVASMLPDPLLQLFLDEDPLLADLMGGQPVFDELVDGLVADSQELLSLGEGEEYPLDTRIFRLFSGHVDFPALYLAGMIKV